MSRIPEIPELTLVVHFGLAERNAALVLGRNDRLALKFPINLQVGIVPGQRALKLWEIVFGRLVQHVGRFGNHPKAVSQSRGNPYHALVFTGQRHCLPAPEGGGGPSQVHRYIQNFPRSPLAPVFPADAEPGNAIRAARYVWKEVVSCTNCSRMPASAIVRWL